MIKKSALIVLAFAMHVQVFSQENQSATNTNVEKNTNSEVVYTNAMHQNSQEFQQYWTFGGGIGFSFWDNQTSILLAPKAYYNVSPKFLTGFGLTYIYSDQDLQLFEYSSNSFGGSVMAGFRPIRNLQLDIEYEGIQTSRRGVIEEDFWNNALYLGVGFIAGKVSFGFRYDVLFDDYKSSYASAFNPVIGFYF